MRIDLDWRQTWSRITDLSQNWAEFPRTDIHHKSVRQTMIDLGNWPQKWEESINQFWSIFQNSAAQDWWQKWPMPKFTSEIDPRNEKWFEDKLKWPWPNGNGLFTIIELKLKKNDPNQRESPPLRIEPRNEQELASLMRLHQSTRDLCQNYSVIDPRNENVNSFWTKFPNSSESHHWAQEWPMPKITSIVGSRNEYIIEG